MGLVIERAQVLLRVCVILVLVLTACLVAFDTQTKVVFLAIEKKATYADLESLKMLVYIASASAGYNMLQLMRGYCGGKYIGSKSKCVSMAWVCLLLDELVAYVTFGANSAAITGSMLAVTGAEALQWVKICNKFGRFCSQIGGAVLCGYLASLLLALISSLSAYNLFTLYSPNSFLTFKTTTK